MVNLRYDNLVFAPQEKGFVEGARTVSVMLSPPAPPANSIIIKHQGIDIDKN